MEPSPVAPLGPVGLWTFGLSNLPNSRIAELAAEIEQLGYGSVWFPETPAGEPFVVSTLVLAATQTLAAGTGIASIWLRHPATTQSTARSLERAFPGRFVLGLGVSHAPLVNSLFPGSYDRPLVRMREYLDAMDAPPPGREPPEQRPARVLAALGDRMLELARDRADGAHPYNVTPEHTAHARAILGSGKLLVTEQAVALGDTAFVREVARRHLAIYAPIPNYRNNWLRLGFSEEDLADGGSDRLCDAMVAGGTPEAIRARIAEHLDAGADHVVVQVLTKTPGTAPIEQWRELAPALWFKDTT